MKRCLCREEEGESVPEMEREREREKYIERERSEREKERLEFELAMLQEIAPNAQLLRENAAHWQFKMQSHSNRPSLGEAEMKKIQSHQSKTQIKFLSGRLDIRLIQINRILVYKKKKKTTRGRRTMTLFQNKSFQLCFQTQEPGTAWWALEMQANFVLATNVRVQGLLLLYLYCNILLVKADNVFKWY